MLHINNYKHQQNSTTETPTANNKTAEETAVSNTVTVHAFALGEQVLLAIVVALAVSPYTKTTIRALLDSESQKNLITEEMVQALRLKKDKVKHVISGIGEIVQHASSSVWLKIKSRVSNYSVYLPLIVVPKITGQLPPQNIKTCNVPDNIELADPHFNTPQKIDILLAVGPISENSLSKISTSNAFFSTTDIEPTLENVLQQFWLIENISDTPPYTIEERTCQEYFKNTVIRNNEGRFVVHLPFRDDVTKLGKSYEIAKRRLLAIERKFQKDKKLKEEYFSFMKEYELLNHMERVDNNESEKADQTCYLPHHAVRKDSSISTKFQVVFDASCKTKVLVLMMFY
ncbi:uncharacterized protein LOC112680993 [Sipha flava]|uniref:Uncharacterized protein LOC112680993 n=1 Tax=Sipha flava TaxID=143950 RepID=A0A8B8F9H1_9HEMI|nr:uncharacterized protein LOC112680993 [Sipha flava]